MTSRTIIRQGVVNPTSAPNDLSWVRTPSCWKSGAGHGVLYAHSRGANATTAMTNPSAHIQALVDAGYAVGGVDLSSLYAYGRPLAVKTFDELATYMFGTIGVAGTRLGTFLWSNGGFTGASWGIRNPTKYAGGVWYSPALDLDWYHGGSAVGYTPGFTLASTGLPSTAEIDTAFTNVGSGTGAATTTATGSVTVPASGGAGVTVPLTTALNFGDPATKGSDSRASQVIVNSVVCTYTGISGNSLTGVVSTTGSTVAVVNGTVVSTTYANNVPGYDPMKRAADFSALPGTTQIVHPSDDVTVSPAASDRFAAVAGGGISVRSPKPTGGHSGSFFNVPVYETVALFNSLTYT